MVNQFSVVAEHVFTLTHYVGLLCDAFVSTTLSSVLHKCKRTDAVSCLMASIVKRTAFCEVERVIFITQVVE